MLAIFWSLVIPLGEGPDETGHWDYALFLARTGHLPNQSGDQPDVPGEGHQPPLAYWLLQPVLRSLPAEQRTLVVQGNPDFRWAGGSEPNAYLHGVRENPPFRGALQAWHLARGISIALGSATIILCWATARMVFSQRRGIALGAAAVLGWNPQWIFQHSLVSNDPLTIAVSAALIFGCVATLVVTPPAPRGVACTRRTIGGRYAIAALLGLILGLLLLSKQSGLALLPLPILTAALGMRLHSWRHRFGAAATVLSMAGLIAGWWYLRNLHLYGDPLGLRTYRRTFASHDFNAGSWASWRDGLWTLFRSSWGLFGWQTVPLPGYLYILLLWTLILAVPGLGSSIARGWWHSRSRLAALLVMTTVLVVIWLLLFALTAGSVAWQGRFLFLAAVPLAIFLSAGWAALVPRSIGLYAVAGALLALAAAVPTAYLRPAYALQSRMEQDVPVDDTYIAFEGGAGAAAELRGRTLPRQVATGSELPVSLTWHATAPFDRSWWLFVHVVDGAGHNVAQSDGPPLNGNFPTTKWVPGDWCVDRRKIDLRAVPPGQYSIRIGLFDPAGGERLTAFDHDHKSLGDDIQIALLSVIPTQ
ncbi:MAG: hypothetical protein NVS2B7_19520 [Herpetosiphon sp.]